MNEKQNPSVFWLHARMQQRNLTIFKKETVQM
jgi:hypothetical protein